MMCWILTGTSMDLNLAARSGALCGLPSRTHLVFIHTPLAIGFFAIPRPSSSLPGLEPPLASPHGPQTCAILSRILVPAEMLSISTSESSLSPTTLLFSTLALVLVVAPNLPLRRLTQPRPFGRARVAELLCPKCG
ncbi:hypothetical protein NL676_024468 [Syzygium grande]|nr:hypothetical protein NL676_024468 [Syzygium grande]